MLKLNFDPKWVTLLAFFSVLLFCVITFPKIGKTHHTEFAKASASAQKTGENWAYSTFRADASSSVSAPVGDIGVWELYAEVTGKRPINTPQIAYAYAPPKSLSKSVSRGKTYYALGDGANMVFSAKSDADVTGAAADDEAKAAAVYP